MIAPLSTVPACGKVPCTFRIRCIESLYRIDPPGQHLDCLCGTGRDTGSTAYTFFGIDLRFQALFICHHSVKIRARMWSLPHPCPKHSENFLVLSTRSGDNHFFRGDHQCPLGSGSTVEHLLHHGLEGIHYLA